MKKFSLPVLFLLFLLCAAFRLHARPQMEEGRLFPLPEAGSVEMETAVPSPVPEPVREAEIAAPAAEEAPAVTEPPPEAEIAAPVPEEAPVPEPVREAEITAPAAEEAPAVPEPPPEAEIAAPVAEEAPAVPEPPPETAEVPAEDEGAAGEPPDGTPSTGPPPPELAVAPSPAVTEPAETAVSETAARNRPFVVFNEGVTASWLTRIIKQSGRSNFVFKDFLPGLYFGMELVNLKSVFPKFPLVPQLRLAAYYPFKSTFNDIPQPAKLPLHIAADAILGAGIKLSMLKYVRFSLTPGVHFFFLNSERWNYFNLGAAGILGMELPVSAGWTILINGTASFDNGNLGKNGDIEPFDIVYQYQVDVGVRFSKKARNEHPWIKPGAPRSPRP